MSEGFKITLGVLLGLILGVLVLFELMARTEVVSSNFDSYEELAKSGMIEKGWVPTWIPESVGGIREVHDVDTNFTVIRYSADARLASEVFRDHCTRNTQWSSQERNSYLPTGRQIIFFPRWVKKDFERIRQNDAPNSEHEHSKIAICDNGKFFAQTGIDMGKR